MPAIAAAIRQNPQMFAFLASFPGMVFIRDGGRIVYSRNLSIIGLNDEEAIGRTIGQLVGPEVEFQFRMNDARILAGEPVVELNSIPGYLWQTALWRIDIAGRALIAGVCLPLYRAL